MPSIRGCTVSTLYAVNKQKMTCKKLPCFQKFAIAFELLAEENTCNKMEVN